MILLKYCHKLKTAAARSTTTTTPKRKKTYRNQQTLTLIGKLKSVRLTILFAHLTKYLINAIELGRKAPRSKLLPEKAKTQKRALIGF